MHAVHCVTERSAGGAVRVVEVAVTSHDRHAEKHQGTDARVGAYCKRAEPAVVARAGLAAERLGGAFGPEPEPGPIPRGLPPQAGGERESGTDCGWYESQQAIA